MRAHLLLLAAGNLAVLTACADHAPTGPTAPPPSIAATDDLTVSSYASRATVTVPTDPDSPWARIFEGQHGRGALYAVYIPKVPNQTRDAVLYAHGIRDVTEPLSLRNQDDFYNIRDQLGKRGYTVAYSSYAENGFAVKDGSLRTLELSALAAWHMRGIPGRTYLMGHSLGAGIALNLVEKFPRLYDGALLMCGIVGGSRVQTQYVANVRALFDFFYPGALPGSVLESPGRVIAAEEVQAFFISKLANQDPRVRAEAGAKLLAMASTREASLPYVPAAMIPTLVGSVAGALNFHSRGIDNILDLLHGATPFDNSGGYTLGDDPMLAAALPRPTAEALIATANLPAPNGVPRYTFGPGAEEYLERYFTPTGKLRVPVFTLSSAWDPGVPGFHEKALFAAADREQATGNLFQKVIPFRNSLRHCDINWDDAVPAFDALVNWVASGVKPAS